MLSKVVFRKGFSAYTSSSRVREFLSQLPQRIELVVDVALDMVVLGMNFYETIVLQLWNKLGRADRFGQPLMLLVIAL